MKNSLIILLTGLAVMFAGLALAQGPPITTDKPIMLGADKLTLRTLAFYRHADAASFFALPLMAEYTLSNRFELSAEVPVIVDFSDEALQTLGDVTVKAKYQFYRKDQTGRTTRFVTVGKYTAPTGAGIGIPTAGMGVHQVYLGLAGGIESIRYGLQSELGYMLMQDMPDYISAKAGFGLPLLKPVYPVNQLNVYFEYDGRWVPYNSDYALFFAQGLQYARGRFTWDVAVKMPLAQQMPHHMALNYILMAGFRVVI